MLYLFPASTVSAADTCAQYGPLGMISGDIEDWQITASSNYPTEWDAGCGAKYARPYLDNRLGWCSRLKSSSEWLQIDIGVITTVSVYSKYISVRRILSFNIYLELLCP